MGIEGYRVDTEYETDLDSFSFRQKIDKVKWNNAIDNSNFELKEELINNIICKSSCGSFLKRYNPLLLDKVVDLYKEHNKYKECLDLLHPLLKDCISDSSTQWWYNEDLTIEKNYNKQDKRQKRIYEKLQNMLNIL